jgi:protein TonB
MHAPTPVTSTARARVPAITRPVAASSASPRVPPAATGGEGTDVLHIDSRGDAFPFPAYLKNVVRQIGMRFQPGGAIRGVADVHFLIQRDGHISELRVVQSTGGYALNTEAMGAIESAGNAGAFGPLPSGWKDDVLEVTFHFAPVAR